METVRQDLKYGLRSLLKSRGFAFVAVVTLALAIGVNTSIFSLVNVIVFADLPMMDRDGVALIRSVNPELEIDQGSISPADYADLVERTRSFESLSALTEAEWVLTGSETPIRVQGLRVSASLLETWRLPPVLGRGFATGEDVEGAAPVVMLTNGFWQERFSGDPGVLGETLRLDGSEYTIIGVTDPRFEFAEFRRASVITPLSIDRTDRSRRSLFVSGRLGAGVSHDQAGAEVAQIGQDLADEHSAENRGWGIWSAPVMESLIDEDGRTILVLLQLTVGMVILIACANIANMLLARATARAREMSVRAALGAGRARLVRQLLVESLVISAAAAVLGLGIAVGLNKVLIWISAGTEEVFLMAEFDARVLAFTLLVALLAPLFFGLFPALRTARDGGTALREGRSADGGRSGKRARGFLVTAQVSLAMTLMIVAGLLTRTVVSWQLYPLGYDTSGLATIELRIPDNRYETEEARRTFFDEVKTAVEAVPGIERAELASSVPGAHFGALRSVIVEGVDVPEGRAAPTGRFITVSPGLYDLLGLGLVAGRSFSESDRAETPHVTVVSVELAERFWQGQDPLGRRLQIAGADEWLEVVGVAADVKDPTQEDQSAPYLYLPHSQDALGRMYVVARSLGDEATMAGALREAVWSVDSDQPVGTITTMDRLHYTANASDYALLTLFIAFAVFALAMAAIGIYGVMAYSVSQRRSEIGLRMALGAEAGTVRWLVMGQGARLLAAGVLIGLVVSVMIGRMLTALIHPISPLDPVTFVGVPLVLGVVALLANLLPARRATSLDPAATLRAE